MSKIHQCQIKTFNTNKGIRHSIIYHDKDGGFLDKCDLLTISDLVSIFQKIDCLVREEPLLSHDKLIDKIRKR